MKTFRFNSLSFFIIAVVGVFLIITGGVSSVISAASLRTQAYRYAEKNARDVAGEFSFQIESRIEMPLNVSRALAQMMTAQNDPQAPAQLTRDQANAVLRSALLSNPGVQSLYTMWEPNLFDGQDAAYAGAPGHDQTGRFLPYWTRLEDGSVAMTPLVGYDNPEEVGGHYNYAMWTRLESISEPYKYPIYGRETWMISAIVPVEFEGLFYGIIGIDLPISFMQAMIDEANQELYQGEGKTVLISNSGKVVVANNQSGLTGLDLSRNRLGDIDFAPYLTQIRASYEAFSQQAGDKMLVFVPVYFGNVRTPWTTVVILPDRVIGAEANTLMLRQIALGSGLTLVALLALWLISQRITRPITQMTEIARQVSEGNLDLQAPYAGRKDELGVMARVFNEMITDMKDNLTREHNQRTSLEETVKQYVEHTRLVGQGNLGSRLQLDLSKNGSDPLMALGHNLNDMTENLQTTIAHIRNSSTKLASAAAEIQAATTQQASGATQQSAAISQTSTTVDEVKTIVDQSTQRAKDVTLVAQRTVEVSKSGIHAVQETIAHMTDIKQQVESIAENILVLSEQTQQIGEIISTVNDLASQSHMLALNASVEAARAGEHGKGFAVVAVEVRNLAEQSRQATSQVKSILSEIQKATNTTVMATEEGTKGVDRGVELAAEAQNAIEQLAMAIGESAQASLQLAASGSQQMSGIEQIAIAMHSINQVTLQSLASTREAERAAQNLNILARHMMEVVDKYQ